MYDILINMERIVPEGVQSFVDLLPETFRNSAIHRFTKIEKMPVWTKSLIKRLFAIQPTGFKPIVFIEARDDTSFERLQTLTKTMKRILDVEPVIVADNLNPRLRPLLVRERIAFVDRSLNFFAPNLGIRLSDLKVLSQTFPEAIAEELSPFGIKLLAGFLTDQLTAENFKLKGIWEELHGQKHKVALSKISLALKEFLQLGLVDEHGRGPGKYYTIKDRNELWRALLKLPRAKLFKRIEHIAHPKKGAFVWSGETALSMYGNLNEPDTTTIAVKRSETGFFDAEFKNSDFKTGERIVIEAWKEDPLLFAIDGMLNPVELYFSVQNIADDARVHKELTELLGRYGLTIERKEA